LVSAQDYYPFGTTLPGRTFQDDRFSGYRFTFNGKEKDDEVKGRGNALEFGGRSIYDSRLGRFISIDPRYRDFPYMSSYVFAANDPMRFVDINGEGPGDRIAAARAFIGKSYKKEAGSLRTANSEEALKSMDCSETICRVLAADNFTKGVKSMNTSALIDYMNADESNWEEVNTPKAGDVILWNGHTALVIGYDANKKQVSVIHGTNYGQVSGVVEETYSMEYYKGKGAAFYRPINDMPDGDLLNAPKFRGFGGLANLNPKKWQELRKNWLPKATPANNDNNTKNSGKSESNSDLKNSVKFTPPSADTSDPSEVPAELND